MNEVLARRYARAYQAVYKKKMGDEELDRLIQFLSILKSHKHAFFYTTLSQIAGEKKIAVLSAVARQYGLEEMMQPLMQLLLAHRRLVLLPAVVESLVALYEEQAGRVPIDVTSALELSAEDKKRLEAAIARATNKKIYADYSIDSSLIAGVRIVSRRAGFMSEQSLRQSLNTIALLAQGITWN
jgi:ATP synthase F1 delta subunit